MGDAESALIGRLIREGLERVLSPTVASAVLFDALRAWDAPELPSDSEGLDRFIERALAPELRTRLGEEAAADMVGQLAALADLSLGHSSRRRDETTVLQRTTAGPVRVLIIAQQRTLALRLRTALGADAVAAHHVPSAQAARGFLRASVPALLIIDAVSPVADDLAPIVELLDLAEKSLVLVWGCQTVVGKRTAELAQASREAVVGLDSTSGAELLVDYVLSRTAE